MERSIFSIRGCQCRKYVFKIYHFSIFIENNGVRAFWIWWCAVIRNPAVILCVGNNKGSSKQILFFLDTVYHKGFFVLKCYDITGWIRRDESRAVVICFPVFGITASEILVNFLFDFKVHVILQISMIWFSTFLEIFTFLFTVFGEYFLITFTLHL